MGNWRTVNIVGTMGEGDAIGLRTVLDRGDELQWKYWGRPFACLSFSSTRPGLAGIGMWPHTEMNRCGNLAERGYDVEDVAAALTALVGLAPSMLLKVHCGGDYEAAECVATVSVGEGLVVVGKPERVTVDTPSDDQVLGNLYRNLMH